MSWKETIFKPKWQHRDAEVRKQAVAELDDPALLAELDRICATDEDPGVRAAAAARVDDLARLIEAAAKEQDKAVGEVLQQRISDLAAATENPPPLALRLQVIKDTPDRDLIERVAEHAPEAELRIAALQRVKRQGFLGDRAIHDPDQEVRRAAAAAISQRSTLQRVIDETRTRDKAMHHALAARLKAELLAAGDPEAVQEEAQELCVALERVAVEHLAEAAEVPADLAERWSRIESQVPDELARRYERARARVTTAEPAPPPAPTPPPKEAPPAEETATKGMAPGEAEQPAVPAPLAGLLDELQTRLANEAHPPSPGQLKRLEARLQAIGPLDDEAARAASQQAGQMLNELERRTQAQAHARDAVLEKARALLGEYADQLEEGMLHKALETRQALQLLGEKIKRDRQWKEINTQLTALHGRLRELRDWQHWANDTKRKRLITEMELLPKADLHPDAMLDRIKALQQQWKELEHSEQIPGEQHFAAAPWMWRKFRAAGQAAFNATKPFLEKRSELQEKHQQELQDRIDRLKELAQAETPEWPALAKALKQARRSFRELEQVPAKARKKLASRLRKVIDKASTLMESHYDEIEKEKRKLIRAAEQLPFIEDRDEAIAKAKHLQAEWKAAGSLWRKRENPLWEAFRAPIDPLFDDLKAEQQEHHEARQQHRAAQQQLCDDLQAILDAGDAELAAAEGKLRGLKERWNDIEFPDRKIRARFDRQARDFEERLQRHRERTEQDTRRRWWDKAQVLHEWEAAVIEGKLSAAARKKLAGRWPEAESTTDTDRELDRRFAAAQAGESPDRFSAEALGRASELCIQLEFLSGLPSPGEERERRMEYQVQRLAQSMSGEGRQSSALDEARQAERDWLTLPPLAAADYARLKQRIETALQELYGTINVI